ncbi:MAG: radical SAM protein [Candidatus Heimdallarchaeota archaeon]
MPFSKREQLLILNLSELLPFSLSLSDEALILTKGVMRGEIPIESLLLELQQDFTSIQQMHFSKNKNGQILLMIGPKSALDKEALESTLREIISLELPNNLKNSATKKPLIFIPADFFGFPLVGSLYFGVIDRGTNLLQVRPITGCPLNCPFCSVDEGPASKSKVRDFIVDPDYLISTYNYILSEKKLNGAEAHIDGQGEPMSYPYLVELVQRLWENNNTAVVSLQTDGWFLNEQIIDELSAVKLSRINLSINAFDSKLAKRLAGRGDYNLEKMLELAEYILDSNISLLLAPIWIPEINDSDIELLIKFFSKKKRKNSSYPLFGIQNYEIYSEGRHVKGVKQKDFKLFYKQLRELESRYRVQDLVLTPKKFGMYKTKLLPIPMKRNEIVKAKIVLPGRLQNEVLATARRRLIHVRQVSPPSIGKKIKIRITRNRHNLFFGVPA